MHLYQREIVYRRWCRSARWSWWLGRFALLVCLLTAGLLRYRFLSADNAAVVLVSGFAIAVVAALLAVFAFVRIWREDERGVVSAIAGLVCALAVLAVPAAVQAWLHLRPGSEEVSTDAAAPPPYARSQAALNARDGHVPAMPPAMPPATPPAIPDASAPVVPLLTEAAPAQVMKMVLQLSKERGWQVVDTVPPGGRRGDGHVDAIAWTPFLRLPIDITVRVRPIAGGTRVDMRCVSRHRRLDISDNAGLARAFLDDLADRSDEAPAAAER